MGTRRWVNEGDDDMADRKRISRASRTALAAALVVAVLGLVPGRAEAFYIPKPSAVLVSKTSSQVTVIVNGLRKDLKLQPTAQVIHFSAGSDPYVNYAFLYNPGAGKDGVLRYWVSGGKIQTSFKEFPVSGRYRPFAYGGGIFWYAPGAASDSIWKFNADATSYTSTPQDVRGDFTPVWWQSRMCCDSVKTTSALIWYDPGPQPDMMWIFDGKGGHTVKPLTINGTYRPLYGQFVLDGTYEASDVLWYSQDGPEYVWSPTSDVTEWASYKVGDIGPGARPVVGSYRTDPIGQDSSTVLWYRPGPQAETYWLGGPGTGPNHTMAASPAGQINGDYRPLAYGYHDVLLLGAGTTGQIAHFTDAGLTGTIKLTGLPANATGESSYLNFHA